jgi:N-acetylneuraminic acid mutarotase
MKDEKGIIRVILGVSVGWAAFGSGQLAFAQNGTWTTVAPMLTGRTDVGCAAVDGRLYVVGGRRPSDNGFLFLDGVEAYNPTNNSWTTRASMPTGRCTVAVGVVDGVLYAAGGWNEYEIAFRTLEAYNPVTDTWTTKAPMPTGRDTASAGVVNGILYVVGGSPGGTRFLRTVEAYDPRTDTWATKAPMPTARTGAAAGVVNGILYVVGGGMVDEQLQWHILPTVEAYDPKTDTWTTKAPLPVAAGGLAVSVVNGRLYAMGGGLSPLGPVPTAGVYVYDVSRNVWSAVGPMPTARLALGADAIKDVVYAVGGSVDGNTPLATVEAFTPCQPQPASGSAEVVKGFVVGVNVTDGGCGYTNAPQVLIRGGGGSGAVATATVSNGVVVSITVVDAGSGYSATPMVYLASPMGPQVGLVRAVKPAFCDLSCGFDYQLQISTDMTTWTNYGAPFTATNAAMAWPEYFDVDNWGKLFFRLQ